MPLDLPHAPLIITPDDALALARLRAFADAHPIHMPAVMKLLKSESGRRVHFEQMHARNVSLTAGPYVFEVTYSLEMGHPSGTCRHLSMSVQRAGRAPHPLALQMVMEHFGFTGGLDGCTTWPEQLAGGGVAINVVQPIPN